MGRVAAAPTPGAPTTPPPHDERGQETAEPLPATPTPPRSRDERGQGTAEYALVILAACGLALGVVAWATNTGAIVGLFQAVVDRLTGSI
jgi:hypothetical protein